MIDFTTLTLSLWLATLSQPVPPHVHDYRLEAPPDRRDPTVYRTGPDSAHVEAHVSGNAYLRFPEVKVTAGRVYRLRFHVLIALGTQGECSAKVSRYADLPDSWRPLGYTEIPLNVVGRWQSVDEMIAMKPGTTTVAVEFAIRDACECGECWIDDVSLSPKGEPIVKGP